MHSQTSPAVSADQGGRFATEPDFRSTWLRQIAADRRLVGYAPRVAIAISDQLDPRTHTASCSQQGIADSLRITDRTVRAAVAALINRGFLQVVVKRQKGKPNIYRLLIGGRRHV